jgi:hypothetical protein
LEEKLNSFEIISEGLTVELFDGEMPEEKIDLSNTTKI